MIKSIFNLKFPHFALRASRGKQIFNSKAFTLVELIIFMGLFAVLLIVLTNIFVSTLNVQLESQAISNVQQDGRYILARLAYDINQAANITAPSSLSLGATSGSLQFQLTIEGPTYTYTTNGSNQLTLQGIPITSFGSTISQLSFIRIGTGSNKDSILISFTLTSTTSSLGKGTERKTFTSTVGMRGN